MPNTIKFVIIGSPALVIALALSACSITTSPASRQSTAAPSYGNWPGMMSGGGMMGGGMMGGGMMGGYGSSQSAPTAEPTPIGATPVPVDKEIQITATNLRFAPAQIAVKPGETVRFVVTNDDAFLHNFVGQEAGIPLLNLPGWRVQTAEEVPV